MKSRVVEVRFLSQASVKPFFSVAQGCRTSPGLAALLFWLVAAGGGIEVREEVQTVSPPPDAKQENVEDRLVLPVPVAGRIGCPYPEEMRRGGKEGDARVSYAVDANGVARDVRIESRDDAFGRALAGKVSATKFIAGTRDGRPTTARMSTTVRFRLAGCAEESVVVSN